MTSRRHFIHSVPVAAAALLAGRGASAQTPMLDEKDPQAVALGYVADATKANKTKYPQYAPGNVCSNCQLYQGEAAGANGPCTLFAGKKVTAKGWCSAWVKKG